MTAIARGLQVSRSNLYEKRQHQRRKRVRADDDVVLAALKAVVGERCTYGYRRAVALANRKRKAQGLPCINHKRAYRLLRQHGLLLPRHTGRIERRHEGKVATLKSDLRWCSDGFEFWCFNGEKIYVVFGLDCCDREVLAFEASTENPTGETVRNVMAKSIETRFGNRASKAPHPIEWLSDNGKPYTAHDTRNFGKDAGFLICNTPAYSPESNGMAEAFVKTFKRDYVYVNELPSAAAVLQMLPAWFADYNENHPHRALKMKSPSEYRRAQAVQETVGGAHRTHLSNKPNADVVFVSTFNQACCINP